MAGIAAVDDGRICREGVAGQARYNSGKGFRGEILEKSEFADVFYGNHFAPGRASLT